MPVKGAETPKVCIVGAGATAAFIYQACKAARIRNPHIYTDKIQKPGVGAFYFHWLPEAIQPEKATKIGYVRLGDEAGYIEKQWPHLAKVWAHENWETSFPEETKSIKRGYDAHVVWDQMWDGARIDVVPGNIDDSDLKDYATVYDLVFHTFPTQKSMTRRKGQVRFLIRTFPVNKDFKVGVGLKKLVGKRKHWIIYSGRPEDEWVRMSYVFGVLAWEYSHIITLKDIEYKQRPNYIECTDLLPGTRPYRKRLASNIISLGRLAMWDRSYLSHRAYQDTLDILKQWNQEKTGWVAEP